MTPLTFSAAAPNGLSTPAASWPAIGPRAGRWAVLAIGAGAFALLLAAALQLRASDELPDAAVATAAERAAVTPRARPLVATGVVDTIRELPDADGGTRRFEMTIRMRDGTSRTSIETGSSRWQAGDKVTLLGGPGS